MKTVDDFYRKETVAAKDMNQAIIDTTSNPVSYFQIGNTYQYYSHKFSIWARGCWMSEKDKEKGARTVFEVSFDGNADEKMYMDSTAIKKRIGDPRTNRDGSGSVNDEKSGKATPVADLDVCTKKANNAYKAELAAIATLQKRFGARIVSDVAELCAICVDNTAQTMYAAAKEKERKAIAAKKETKEFAANVASNKASIDEIKAALAAEKAKEQPDVVKIMELTNKLLELL